jgi:hypothetical protein
MTPTEIYRALEDVFETTLLRETSKFLGTKDYTAEELQRVRGRAQATKELITHVRNTLGYSPEEL